MCTSPMHYLCRLSRGRRQGLTLPQPTAGQRQAWSGRWTLSGLPPLADPLWAPLYGCPPLGSPPGCPPLGSPLWVSPSGHNLSTHSVDAALSRPLSVPPWYVLTPALALSGWEMKDTIRPCQRSGYQPTGAFNSADSPAAGWSWNQSALYGGMASSLMTSLSLLGLVSSRRYSPASIPSHLAPIPSL